MCYWAFVRVLSWLIVTWQSIQSYYVLFMRQISYKANLYVNGPFREATFSSCVIDLFG